MWDDNDDWFVGCLVSRLVDYGCLVGYRSDWMNELNKWMNGWTGERVGNYIGTFAVVIMPSSYLK